MPVSYHYPDAPEPRPVLPVRPEALLAAAVIRMALLDARARWASPEHSGSARAFLKDHDGALSFWDASAASMRRPQRGSGRRLAGRSVKPRRPGQGASRLKAASGF
jgi:hypothetical protein